MDNIPEGYCQCGCGRKTNVANRTYEPHGWVKGKPLRFVRGHWLTTPRYLPQEQGYSSPCWIWQRCLNHDGYAYSHRGYEARRAYEEIHGTLPPGLEIDHLCKQRACVRPDHLEAVTHTENIRRASGTKLNFATATEIRRLHDTGTLGYGKLAAMFNVSKPTIAKIIRRRTWTHI